MSAIKKPLQSSVKNKQWLLCL